MIKINNYPQLKLIAWNYHLKYINEKDALDLYERNWRFVDEKTLTVTEKNLIDQLAHDYGNGVLLV